MWKKAASNRPGSSMKQPYGVMVVFMRLPVGS
jgi:hypothetical protein